MRIVSAIALGLTLVASQCPIASAGDPVGHSYAGPGSAYQDPYAGGYGINEAGPYTSDAPYSTGCSACGCAHCGQHRCGLSNLFWRGLPNPHHSTCDMPQHYIYFAEPKFYYYFRPYNWFHIPVQQDDVRAFGGDPRHPYDNRIFQSVYDQLHFNEPAPETIVPPLVPAVPMSNSKPRIDSRAAVELKSAPRSTDSVTPAKTSHRATEPSTVRIRRVSHVEE
jgi:hypothetical protein